MDSVNDILADYNFAEPPEVAAIKKFAQAKFASNVSVRLAGEQIIVSCESAALASSLRSNLSALASTAKTSKKLVIRIG